MFLDFIDNRNCYLSVYVRNVKNVRRYDYLFRENTESTYLSTDQCSQSIPRMKAETCQFSIPSSVFIPP